jgi:hypothetical protein
VTLKTERKKKNCKKIKCGEMDHKVRMEGKIML